jgi:hypothetical protein
VTQPEPRSTVRVEWTQSLGHTTLAMDGVLDGTTHRLVRDAVVKAAMDAPSLVVVDVTELHAASPSVWSVFTSARWLVVQWPDVPIALVCSHVAGRRALARNGIARYLPVYGSSEAAVGAMAGTVRSNRRRVRQTWPSSPSAVASVRGFVSHWLHAWSLDGFAVTTGVVSTVLVENVLRHTESEPNVRLETDGVTVTVAVTDQSPAPACVPEEVQLLGRLSELQIVGALTRVWGNTPIAGGKVVWAVIGPENQL